MTDSLSALATATQETTTLALPETIASSFAGQRPEHLEKALGLILWHFIRVCVRGNELSEASAREWCVATCNLVLKGFPGANDHRFRVSFGALARVAISGNYEFNVNACNAFSMFSRSASELGVIGSIECDLGADETVKLLEHADGYFCDRIFDQFSPSNSRNRDALIAAARVCLRKPHLPSSKRLSEGHTWIMPVFEHVFMEELACMLSLLHMQDIDDQTVIFALGEPAITYADITQVMLTYLQSINLFFRSKGERTFLSSDAIASVIGDAGRQGIGGSNTFDSARPDMDQVAKLSIAIMDFAVSGDSFDAFRQSSSQLSKALSNAEGFIHPGVIESLIFALDQVSLARAAALSGHFESDDNALGHDSSQSLIL